jgi:hypothetical protein
MHRYVVGSFVVSLLVNFAVTAVAWKGELAGVVQPIAVVQEMAEAGDHVAVEGTVKEYFEGDGSVMIVILEDSSGSLPLLVPNHLLREFAGGTAQGGAGPTGVEPTVGNRARVSGRWDHKPMDDETWGIHVQRVEPLGR